MAVVDYHPHQFRHTAATRIRKELGLDAARAVLGHRNGRAKSKTCTLSTMIDDGQVLLPEFWDYRASVKTSISELDAVALRHCISVWLKYLFKKQ